MRFTHLSFNTVVARLVALYERLQRVHWNMRQLLLIPVTAILLMAIGWTLLFARMHRDRNEIEKESLSKAAIIATGQAEQLKFAMDNINQIMLLIREQWDASNGQLKLEDFKSKGLFPASVPFYVGIVNQEGMLQTNTFGLSATNPKADVRDREYFQAHMTAKNDFLYMGLPTLGRTTGLPVIQFSRHLTDKDGRFAGVILLSVRTDYFTSTYSDSLFGKNGFLGVVGVDGIVRATRIDNAESPRQSDAMPTVPALSGTHGSMRLDGVWFSDKRGRYVGWEFVKGYALVALTGLDEQEALAPFLYARTNAIRTGLAITVILMFLTAIAMVLFGRLAWRKKEMERIQATYRMATEGGDEGFYIARPVRDINNAVIDFETVDCNERCAVLFNMRREHCIGKKLTYMHDQKTAASVIQMLLHAMKDGLYEGELETNFGERKFRCIHLKAVSSGENLAVTLRDITSEKQHVRELERLSNQDALTNLPNRLWMNTYLPNAITHASTNNALLAVLFIDLDGFKAVNDTLGHAAGDEVLRNAARRFVDAVRPNDHVVRLGGDEFLVIIENIQHEADAAHVAERVLKAFETNFSITQGVVSIGTSIGISVYPLDALDAATLLQNADIAMYAVKTSGKHRYEFFDQTFYEALHKRLAMEKALRNAIEHDQFVMFYQPRVDMNTGRTSSMEALVRWIHPTQGMIEPVDFIEVAEECGLIVELGSLIINKVCMQIGQWAQCSDELVPVSVNVSSRQLNESNIALILANALAKHRVDPGLIEIELTESTMMNNTLRVSNALHVMHGMGVKLLLDDFGTGYSSLSQLQMLDFDVLKVDKAFTAELGKTEKGYIFFAAIITMAHTLGMRVVAEGVENAKQYGMLKALHCNEIQGFYIAHPLVATSEQHTLFQQIALTN